MEGYGSCSQYRSENKKIYKSNYKQIANEEHKVRKKRYEICDFLKSNKAPIQHFIEKKCDFNYLLYS